jgi:hypothetical protein
MVLPMLFGVWKSIPNGKVSEMTLLLLPPDDSNVVESLAILLHFEEPKLVGATRMVSLASCQGLSFRAVVVGWLHAAHRWIALDEQSPKTLGSSCKTN